ncbi:DUF2268 domain-containing putative Zn-dependent protease [Ureibacillus sp. MALMAid1270]|uniref:DUF2268 domain-containing putative Zn-dependent protease n=1 Tax=Ureibacillus sp. MALMAid1270 TaxID=3411629 RepID=UPI003BA49FD1
MEKIEIIDTKEFFQELVIDDNIERKNTVIQNFLKSIGLNVPNKILEQFGHIQCETDNTIIQQIYNQFENIKLNLEICGILEKLQKSISDVPIKFALMMITPESRFAIEVMKGVTAHTINKNTIIFYVYPFGNLWHDKLEEICIHEFAHVIRNCRLDDKGHLTVLDVLVEEGIAEYTVGSVLGFNRVGIWSNTPLEVIYNYWPIYKSSLLEIDENKIFILLNGGGQQRLPIWLGYSIGYQLIVKYMEKNSHYNLNDLLNINSSDIYSYICMRGELFLNEKD